MQPIHYSFLMNLAILLVFGALAWAFAQPVLVVAGVMLMNHVIGRFDKNNEPDDGPEEPDDDGNGMGFTADVGKGKT